MSSGKQTPLGVNVLGSLLQNIGLNINTGVSSIVGTSHTNTTYTPGTLVTDTVLNKLTSAITLAYNSSYVTSTTYNNLISIGSATIPALGNSVPSTYTFTGPINYGDSGRASYSYWTPYDKTNSVTQYGFIRLFALQAWNEFNWNGTSTDTSVVYKDFLSSFITCNSFINYSNPAITSVKNSSTFLQGTYSNINDLSSADVTGVSLATRDFGQDLIASGKVIDLSHISSFGLPSVLLKTMQQYNANTQSVNLALLGAGITSSIFENIMSGQPVTKEQERQIYSAFLLIMGIDLYDVLVLLNCKTKGLQTLADLLNPMKLFPNSYQTLTVPIYNSTPGPTNSKTYYPIYGSGSLNKNIKSPAINSIVGTTIISGTPQENISPGTNNDVVNIQLLPEGFGSYLTGILPPDIATACGAFGTSMGQIKNIQNSPVEKFAQVVSNIETMVNLDLVGGTDVPVDSSLALSAANNIAKGSGLNGTYTVSDFFGAMSGLPYSWQDIQTYIEILQTNTLSTIYTNLYNTILAGPASPGGPAVAAYNAAIQTLIDAANAEILAISIADPTNANTLNTLYQTLGTQLTIEQAARNTALVPVPSPTRDTTLSQYPMTDYSFVDSIPIYALDTAPHMASQTLEAISDWSTVGGQSVVAMLRTARNQARLEIAGIPLDDAIPGIEQDKLLIANGTTETTGPGITGPTGTYTIPSVLNINNPPVPAGYYDTDVNSYMLTNTTIGTSTLGEILGEPCSGCNTTQAGPVVATGPGTKLDKGQADEPGSLAGSQYQNLIPANLNSAYISKVLSPSTLNVSEAINQVITCNCDCWI